jgi:hypothetical protein
MVFALHQTSGKLHSSGIDSRKNARKNIVATCMSLPMILVLPKRVMSGPTIAFGDSQVLIPVDA